MHSQTEITVLGAMLLDAVAIDEATSKLTVEDFALDSHRRIFKVMVNMAAANKSIDLVTVMDALDKRKELDAIGGAAYLSFLTEGIPRNPNIKSYVRIVKDKSRGRKGMALCNRYQATFADDAEPNETLANLQADISDIIQDSSKQDEPLVSAYSDAAFDKMMQKAFSANSMGLSYGVQSLNSWTAGMQPGQVTVVGARSGVGKSSLMKQAAVANASKGIPVALFSLEMTREEILGGLWAIVSGVEAKKITRPHLLSSDERSSIKTAMCTVKGWPLRIYDRAETTIDQIVATARMGVRKFGTKLVCVDYAQSVEAEGKDERTKVTSVSRKLTKMAKAEQCSLMLLSQLRKPSNEQSSSFPPTMADLRETGQLENDAHIVISATS
jgi:replicative DNA helicase